MIREPSERKEADVVWRCRGREVRIELARLSVASWRGPALDRRINQGRTDALRQGTMRPWKPSPNPAFDLSAGSPRAQASRGFYSFLDGDSVESRRARPFAASGAPCLTLKPHRARPSSTTTSRPNRSASTRRSPASDRLGLLSRSVWLGKPESNPVTAARPGCASSTGQGGTGSPVPYRSASRADP